MLRFRQEELLRTSALRRIGQVVVVAAVILMAPSEGRAQCPASQFYVADVVAIAYSYTPDNPDPNELDDFIGNGCATVKFGTSPPHICTVYNIPPDISLVVEFTAPSANVTGNGCVFVCQNGICTVRGGDGLPVELMEFSIEDGETGSPEDEVFPPEDDDSG